jgi:hypothetical protein
VPFFFFLPELDWLSGTSRYISFCYETSHCSCIALLEIVGRKTGKLRRTPVGNGRIGAQFWIVAERDGLGAQQHDHFREQLPFLRSASRRSRFFIAARQLQRHWSHVPVSDTLTTSAEVGRMK